MAWTRTSRWMVGAGLVAVVALAAGVFLTSQSDTDSGLVQVNGRMESDQIVVSARVPARISEVLVREGDVVQGGQMDTWTFGVNWYWRSNFKFAVNYVMVDSERKGVSDNPNILGARAQFYW